MELSNDSMPEKKSQHSQDELQSLRDELNLKYEKEIATLKLQNEYWAMEHEKSIELIIENATQKIELEELNKRLQQAFYQLEQESKTDYLTKLLNRGALMESLKVEVKRVSRLKDNILKKIQEMKEKNIQDINKENLFTIEENFGKLCCAIIDIDFFKLINDTYGHLIGDDVLKRIGCILNDQNLLRATDISGRFGGEEFLIILPQTNSQHALYPLQKISDTIREIEFKSDNEETFHITISIGVSDFQDSDKSIDDMIRRADNALYRAKDQGRNRIIIEGN